MICPKCKNTIEDDSRICRFCGFQFMAPQGGQQPGMQQAPQRGQMPGALQKILTSFKVFFEKLIADKKKLAAVIGGIAAIFILLIVIIVLVVTHKTKIDLQDYTEVEFSGYDGYGTASVNLDYDKLMEDFADEADIKESNLNEQLSDLSSLSDLAGLIQGSSNSDYTKMLQVFSEMSCELDSSSELKNGDTVTVSYTFDNELANELGIELIGDELEQEVSGLDAIKEINPFDDVTLSFSGTSPQATASLTYSSSDDMLSEYDFEVEPSSDLAIGDTVKVTVSYDEEALLQEYGCKLTETEKEYTCEDVDAYISSGNDIDDDVLSSMKKQTEDVVEAYFADKDNITQSGLKYVGYYFLSKKNADNWGDSNQIYIVYSAKVKSTDKSFKSATVYFPVKYVNAIQYADGTQYVELNSTSIEGETGLEYSFWNQVPGYIDQGIMKNELLTAQKGSYEGDAFGDLK